MHRIFWLGSIILIILDLSFFIWLRFADLIQLIFPYFTHHFQFYSTFPNQFYSSFLIQFDSNFRFYPTVTTSIWLTIFKSTQLPYSIWLVIFNFNLTQLSYFILHALHTFNSTFTILLGYSNSILLIISYLIFQHLQFNFTQLSYFILLSVNTFDSLFTIWIIFFYSVWLIISYSIPLIVFK